MHSFIQTLLILISSRLILVDSLVCLEGADCLRDASCDQCEGVACTRVTSYNMEDNKEVALTCLPHETRVGLPAHMAHLEEAGCRHLGDRQICVCYHSDYCNDSPTVSLPLYSLLPLLLVTLLL